MQWFEDVPLNERVVLGDYAFTEENIIAFAKKYDPQYFHLDRRAAKDSAFGGLVASGWHTLSVWIKLMIDYRERMVKVLGPDMPNRQGVSPGLRQVRWLKPVRPGTTLTYDYTTVAKKDWPSRPNFGLVERRCEARSKDNTGYLTFVNLALLQRQPAEAR